MNSLWQLILINHQAIAAAQNELSESANTQNIFSINFKVKKVNSPASTRQNIHGRHSKQASGDVREKREQRTINLLNRGIFYRWRLLNCDKTLQL